MWHLIGAILHKVNFAGSRTHISDALALHRRGEVRSDGLSLDNVCNRLEIRWRARDIHPWDRERCMPSYQRERAFMRQALADTEAAILRLFERLPYVDVIELCVLEPASENLIAEGVVHRSVLSRRRHNVASVRMRLAELGVKCSPALVEISDSAYEDEVAALRAERHVLFY